jgi:hypothetical protein
MAWMNSPDLVKKTPEKSKHRWHAKKENYDESHCDDQAEQFRALPLF